MRKKKLVIIGGGAAGFFCAVNAARLNPELEIIIIEKTNKVLSKVKVSGGGRCNVTHACFDIPDMSKKYPRGANFVKKTFHQFFTLDTIQWFEERGVKLKAEEDGRMFPVTDSSQTIIDCLMREVNMYGIQLVLNTEVKSLQLSNEGWKIDAESRHAPAVHDYPSLSTADYICIACGGYPKSGMFEWLRQLGHSIEEPVPSLFTFNLPSGQTGKPAHPITKLMGVSVEQAKVKITGTRLEQAGALLITHWGLSGPAVLKLSAWGAKELKERNWEFGISVNWLGDIQEQELGDRFQSLRFELAAQKMAGKNPFGLPQRLWEFLLEHSGVNREKRWADLPAKEQNKLIQNLCACTFEIKGKTTFKEEFVTAGGVKLNEVDPNTMMSKKTPKLFFAGEVLDVDGITGGFNFQHAWTSGFIVAKSISTLAGQGE